MTVSSDPPADGAIGEALARLSVVDAVAAHDARVALEWLVGDDGLEGLNQLALQQFCWYELPFKWLVEPAIRLARHGTGRDGDERLEVARAAQA